MKTNKTKHYFKINGQINGENIIFILPVKNRLTEKVKQSLINELHVAYCEKISSKATYEQAKFTFERFYKLGAYYRNDYLTFERYGEERINLEAKRWSTSALAKNVIVCQEQ